MVATCRTINRIRLLLPVSRDILWTVVVQLGPAERGEDGGEEGPGEGREGSTYV